MRDNLDDSLKLMFGHEGGENYLNGWLDDVRITKGVARYSASFTPPDKAFPNN